jgi:hypothetical protein
MGLYKIFEVRIEIEHLIVMLVKYLFSAFVDVDDPIVVIPFWRPYV